MDWTLAATLARGYARAAWAWVNSGIFGRKMANREAGGRVVLVAILNKIEQE